MGPWQAANAGAPQSHVVGKKPAHQSPTHRSIAMSGGEAGQVTGTPDKDYNIIWFTEQCLSNVLRLEQYVQDAERAGDSELADFFRRAQGASRKGGEEGKALLKSRIGT
jgi:hypothetical protein